MTADLTREQAREQVARALWEVDGADQIAWDRPYPRYPEDADAALTILWPVVEGLRADLAHAHTVIARHVEPKRSTGSWGHKWPGGEVGA